MTADELISKLSQEGYSEREIRLAKHGYYIGRASVFLEMMDESLKEEARNGKRDD